MHLRSISNFATTIGLRCMGHVHLHGRNTVWTAGRREVSVWDAHTGALLRSIPTTIAAPTLLQQMSPEVVWVTDGKASTVSIGLDE